MPFLMDIPNDVLLCIMDSMNSVRDLISFAQTCQKISNLFNGYGTAMCATVQAGYLGEFAYSFPLDISFDGAENDIGTGTSRGARRRRTARRARKFKFVVRHALRVEKIWKTTNNLADFLADDLHPDLDQEDLLGKALREVKVFKLSEALSVRYGSVLQFTRHHFLTAAIFLSQLGSDMLRHTRIEPLSSNALIGGVGLLSQNMMHVPPVLEPARLCRWPKAVDPIADRKTWELYVHVCMYELCVNVYLIHDAYYELLRLKAVNPCDVTATELTRSSSDDRARRRANLGLLSKVQSFNWSYIWGPFEGITLNSGFASAEMVPRDNANTSTTGVGVESGPD